MRFEVDHHRIPEADDVRAIQEFEFDGYSHVEFVLTHEGFTGNAYNEEGECYKTVAHTFEEFAGLPPSENPTIRELERDLTKVEVSFTEVMASDFEDRQRVERAGAEIFEKLDQIKKRLVAEADTIPSAELQAFREKLLDMLKRLLVQLFRVPEDKLRTSNFFEGLNDA